MEENGGSDDNHVNYWFNVADDLVTAAVVSSGSVVFKRFVCQYGLLLSFSDSLEAEYFSVTKYIPTLDQT